VRPATSALLDQAQAATTDATRIMTGLAVLEQTTVRYVVPGPIHRALITRYSTRALAGQLTLCPDLSWDAPQPAFWCAWAPAKLRCSRCADTASRRIHGTAEDRRCDHCHKIRHAIHRGAMEFPAVVVDLPDRARCVPPVLAVFGLCPDCYNADRDHPECPAGSRPPAEPSPASSQRTSGPPQDVPASGGAAA
jgi:hypothetical protein